MGMRGQESETEAKNMKERGRNEKRFQSQNLGLECAQTRTRYQKCEEDCNEEDLHITRLESALSTIELHALRKVENRLSQNFRKVRCSQGYDLVRVAFFFPYHNYHCARCTLCFLPCECF